jgi:hypothetical protein
MGRQRARWRSSCTYRARSPGASAEHVRRPDHDRIADLFCDLARFRRIARNAALRLAQPQLADQLVESVAVFREINGVRRRAEDRHVRAFQRFGELKRRLAAELHDHPMQRAIAALGIDDLDHVFGRQRFEIKPIRSVVVGRHGLRIAIDHDGLVANFLQCEAGMAAAIVELDALPDTVWPAAEDHHFLLVRRPRLVRGLARERRFVG